MMLQGNIAGCLECCDQNMSVWVCSVALLGEYVCVCVCGWLNEEVDRCKYVVKCGLYEVTGKYNWLSRVL